MNCSNATLLIIFVILRMVYIMSSLCMRCYEWYHQQPVGHMVICYNSPASQHVRWRSGGAFLNQTDRSRFESCSCLAKGLQGSHFRSKHLCKPEILDNQNGYSTQLQSCDRMSPWIKEGQAQKLLGFRTLSVTRALHAQAADLKLSQSYSSHPYRILNSR